MCGIAGVFHSNVGAEELAALLGRMADSMVHRGPDDFGFSTVPHLGAGVACRRLSIVDLATGRQPILNEDGDIAVVLNGEIYNHRDLRVRLEGRGHRFRSAADTEVIVHLYEEEGVDCLGRLNGMFGLAVLDARERRLLLARDPSGMKSLYWTRVSGGLLFASEVKALAASGLVGLEPDWDGLDTLLAIGYAPAPGSCFRNIRKLPAGEYLVAQNGTVTGGTYWRLRFRNAQRPRSDEEHADELESRLRAAVRSHLDADVTVGAFVSGGWDSSLVATFAAEATPRPLKTFSIVFPEDPGLDESRFSRQLAARLGSDHRETEFRAADAPALLAKAVWHLEEPCTAAPVLVNYQLAAIAAREVKAVVSGEGSDELFAGYLWLRSDWYYPLRRVVPRAVARSLQRLFTDQRLFRVLGILGAEDEVSADLEWFRGFSPARKELLLATDRRASRSDTASARPHADTLATCVNRLQRRLSLDFTRRLANGILLIQDKTSMAHSLELRMPFLDRSVIDFAEGLPSDLKIRNGREKYVLSLLARRRLPPEIAQRRKLGLRYPERILLAPPMRSFARDLLLGSAKPGGLFRKDRLESEFDRIFRPPGEQSRQGWLLLYLQSWWNQFIDR
jgi:asparagine synthase (glutamine-hydrolysing)